MTVTLVIAALSIVYALVFCSGILIQVGYVREYVDGNAATLVHNRSQAFSDTFLILGIVLLLTVVLMIIMGCNTRRKYYITNYVAIGIYVAFALVFAILLIVNVVNIQSALNQVNLSEVKEVYEEAQNYYGDWNESTWMLALGYVYVGVLLVNVAVVVLNLVWKIKLMQGEQTLLQSGAVEEVA